MKHVGILRLFPLSVFFGLILSCGRTDLQAVSRHYQAFKDIKSMTTLYRHLKYGMSRTEIAALLGEPSADLNEEPGVNHYITDERTAFGDSFYVLTVKFDASGHLVGSSLSIADE